MTVGVGFAMVGLRTAKLLIDNGSCCMLKSMNRLHMIESQPQSCPDLSRSRRLCTFMWLPLAKT
jgi:hypothetical protein